MAEERSESEGDICECGVRSHFAVVQSGVRVGKNRGKAYCFKQFDDRQSFLSNLVMKGKQEPYMEGALQACTQAEIPEWRRTGLKIEKRDVMVSTGEGERVWDPE